MLSLTHLELLPFICALCIYINLNFHKIIDIKCTFQMKKEFRTFIIKTNL